MRADDRLVAAALYRRQIVLSAVAAVVLAVVLPMAAWRVTWAAVVALMAMGGVLLLVLGHLAAVIRFVFGKKEETEWH